jgi:hypothetical protein
LWAAPRPQWLRGVEAVDSRAVALAAVGREWAVRVEAWVDRSFPMVDQDKADRDKVGQDRQEDRHRRSLGNEGQQERIVRACSLDRRDAGGTTNPWPRA